MNPPRTLVVGIGSQHGDDQAGWRVAEQLAARLDCEDVVVRQASSPAALLDWLDETTCLVICDACQGLGHPGEVRRWNWPAPELVDVSWSGTHNLPLLAVLQLASRLSRLPETVVIWSVEATASSPMEAISIEVASALPKMVNEIYRDIMQLRLAPQLPCTNTH